MGCYLLGIDIGTTGTKALLFSILDNCWDIPTVPIGHILPKSVFVNKTPRIGGERLKKPSANSVSTATLRRMLQPSPFLFRAAPWFPQTPQDARSALPLSGMTSAAYKSARNFCKKSEARKTCIKKPVGNSETGYPLSPSVGSGITSRSYFSESPNS